MGFYATLPPIFLHSQNSAKISERKPRLQVLHLELPFSRDRIAYIKLTIVQKEP